MSTTAANKAKLFLLGPFALHDAAGKNCTPKGKKAQALIAMIALAPRRQRTRVWLRDKLWSESDERKSATSLRQVVFELRRDLGWAFDAIFDLDPHSISFKPGAVWIDYDALQADLHLLETLNISSDTDLLEGIDVKDEEFEDWLLLERQIWQEKSECYFTRASEISEIPPQKSEVFRPADVLPEPLARFSIGVLPNIEQGCDQTTAHIADFVLEGIAKNAAELHRIDLYDFRDMQIPSESIVGGNEADFLMRVRVLQIRASITITFFLYHADRMSLAGSQSIQADIEDVLSFDSYVLAGFVSQNVDRMSKTLTTHRRVMRDADAARDLTGYTALNMMFRLDDEALNNAEKLLIKHQTGADEALFAALQTYAASFKIGENLGHLDLATASDTAQLARHALNQNPFNAISLACLGHTMGYVFQDHALGAELLERALNLNPNQAFVWDHYALNKLYSGDYDAAHDAAKRAVYLGSFSPMCFSYETTLAMTSTMLGQHGPAIQSSRSALLKQPRFGAALRYLLVRLTATGQDEAAEGTYKDILKFDAAFADDEIRKARFRIADPKLAPQILNKISNFK
jgi:tetratricopeptide (TPR) repeat protein